ncbi:YfiR family protein [Pseudoalteromonas sp. SCQQ13]|nr:YfiR family protein [Pseudoalteromonas sp. SCQQ13]
MLKLRYLPQSLLITLMLLPSTSSYAMEKEYQLKAAFLYNFARFSQWHNSLSQREYFTLCSPDKHFVDTASTTLKGRSINKQPIQNKHVALDQISINGCHMLFITSSTAANWQSAQQLFYKNIMLVGEAENFIKNGGQIRFFLAGGKVRFEIAPQKLEEADIAMSSKVLRLARIVKG